MSYYFAIVGTKDNPIYELELGGASDIKLMLLHETKNEDGIRNFFNEAYELYIKILMNPFYEVNSTITSVPFDTKVKFIAKKYL
nr:15412_t:CDS:2 [Entrophospora candida]CAG8590443.1 2314_t:CDS:2 [Entrophospora candida]